MNSNKMCGIVLGSAVGLIACTGAGASVIFASGVADFDQGLRKNGTAVLAERSNPAQAFGAAQNNDTNNFVSLGFGGSIVLTFDSAFGDTQLTVWETTFGNAAGHPESALVYVGAGADADSATYYLAGAVPNTADGAPISLSHIGANFGVHVFQFVKIVDTTNPASHGGDADGFDVDAVSVTPVPTPATGVLASAALLIGVVRRRRSR